MPQKCRISLLVAFFLLGISLSSMVQAQTVDPCSYGCPKAGCPNCLEGGPVKSHDNADKAAVASQGTAGDKAMPVAYDSDKCISSCDMQYDSCIKRGNTNEYCGGQHDACVKSCLEHK